MLPFMLFIFFCFLGIIAVQIYSMHRTEQLVHELREQHAQLRVLLRAVEARLDDREPPESIEDDEPKSRGAGADPLLHLSLDPPSARPQT